MRKSLLALLFAAGGLALTSLAQAEVQLKDGHPNRYTVVKGDTLWDISGKFLRQPWKWPEIWHANPQVANPHLARMTRDRYEMVWDPASPELVPEMIDREQGDVRRAASNLSGGETFLVSLALALGLSNMASGRLQVDSLFLDEGFGTLDEDALDTALETLAGLQRQGKLIGIISHVPAIKERIRTQIQIQPQAGGRSILRGAGVISR